MIINSYRLVNNWFANNYVDGLSPKLTWLDLVRSKFGVK